MLKKLLFQVVCVYLSFQVKAQELQWIDASVRIDRSIATAVVRDESDRIYITGNFRDTLIFDTDTFVSRGNSDIFVMAQDTLGSTLWVRTIGSALNDEASALTIDKLGNIVVTGGINDSAFIDTTLISTQSPNQTLFIAKFNPQGHLQSEVHIPNMIFCMPQDLQVDTDNSLVLTGQFYGNINKDNVSLPNLSGKTFFILQVDPSGIFQWGAMCSGSGNNGSKVAISPDAYYVTGSYSDGATFESTTLHAYGSNHNLFVARYEKNGSLSWIRHVTGPGEVHGNTISVNKNNRIMVGGDYATYLDSLDYHNKGSYDVLLLGYTNNGKMIWANHFGGINQDIPRAASTNGNLFSITGMFSDSLHLDDTTLVCPGANSAFIYTVDENGKRVWIRQLAGTATVDPYGIHYRENKIYVSGYFYDNIIAENHNIPFDTINAGDLNSHYFSACLRDETNLINSAPATETAKQAIRVFPNPSHTGNFHLVIPRENVAESIVVRDILGRKVPCSIHPQTTSVYLISLQEPFPPGWYFVQTSGKNDFSAATRVMIE